MTVVNNKWLKALPQVGEVLQHEMLAQARRMLPHDAVVDMARQAVDEARQRILAGEGEEPSIAAIAEEAARLCETLQRPSLRRVVNASGVIVHTNLGRSMLSRPAIDAVNDVIQGYSTLEYSVEGMERGSRHNHCERLICELTGAEAAIAVNNNAAAVMMVLSEFAAGREALVSRGELVEIGGSFRIPDIMELSGARMVEVGTTNKTHLADYERAIGPETALLLKVHPSNYRMIGFTESVSIAELRKLADTRTSVAVDAEEQAPSAESASQTASSVAGQVPLVYEDQGSGSLVHLDVFGDYAEPTVRSSLAAGADLVSFSGDKLLGGPQAGIIAGRRELIERLKANPLARVLRLDKMTLAALEATLRIYLTPERALEEIPTLRMLTEDAEAVRERAEGMCDEVRNRVGSELAEVEVVSEVSRAGGGALPMCDIPTFALQVRFLQGDAQECGRYLVQECPVPIVARISRETVLFDARTLTDPDEIRLAVAGIASYFNQLMA